MSNFSPTDAALEGVRLTRQRPKTVLIWSGYYFIFTLMLFVVAYLTLGPHAQEMLQEVQRGESDPADAAKLLGQTLPFFAAGFPLSLLFMTMLISAIYRAVLASDASATRFRLGAQEWRLAVLIIIAALIVTGVLFLSNLVVGDVAAIGGSGLVYGVVAIAAVAAILYLFVRLSLAGPATFAQGRLVVFKSWPLTHGHFWKLLGAYVMAGAVCMVVLVLMTLIFGLVFSLFARVTGLSITGLEAAASSPGVFIVALAWQAVNAFMSTCCYVILLAPSAQAYRDITASTAAASA
jgi:hypothetical protein